MLPCGRSFLLLHLACQELCTQLRRFDFGFCQSMAFRREYGHRTYGISIGEDGDHDARGGFQFFFALDDLIQVGIDFPVNIVLLPDTGCCYKPVGIGD